ncbi:unnamed protein product [Phytophthora fragariaefolia]|uniref:Unnamed protein product n=1 Tax=Phytophthora fragariaefolia TaxID=1490495 RepID=A0A9W6XF29_9STRA|nr:unnamed protein product [Phytophthora fragariaefolia]
MLKILKPCLSLNLHDSLASGTRWQQTLEIRYRSTAGPPPGIDDGTSAPQVVIVQHVAMFVEQTLEPPPYS